MVSRRDRAVFFRSLSVMFSAGISLQQGLRMLSQQLENSRMQAAASGIEQALKMGHSFSNAIERYPELFEQLHRRTIRVAEASGSLPRAMERVAVHEEKAHRAEMQLRQAMIYPVWILTACLVFVVVVPPWLFRELFGVIERSGVELPMITMAVMGFSKLLTTPLFYLFLIPTLAGLGWAAWKAWSKEEFRCYVYSLAHEIWGLGPALKARASARFARSLEMMTEVGIPLNQAFLMAANATADPVLEKKAPLAVERLLNGATVAGALASTEYFPSLFLQAVEVGSEAGANHHILDKVADIFDTELEYRTGILLAALEPMAMLFMGIAVGITIISTMIPMMKIVQTL